MYLIKNWLCDIMEGKHMLYIVCWMSEWCISGQELISSRSGLVVNYGISNTIVLEIP